jgi:hypothetical protein
VIVPVLSEHKYFAAPIVSQDYNLRTNILSLYIDFIEYAKVKVTANGNPYGIDTAITVTLIIR